MDRILIIGGKSLIGFNLAILLKKQGILFTTSRDKDDNEHIFFDYAYSNADVLVEKISPNIAYLCVGITNIQQCEDDPLQTSLINVNKTIDIASELIRKGCFVIFISSNTVFDGNTPYPFEDSNYCPLNEYGRQKMLVEKALFSIPDASDRIAVVRLTKVVSSKFGIFYDFLSQLSANEKIIAYSDLRLSPITIDYVCSALNFIGLNRLSGIFHLSGEKEIFYSDLAFLLAERFNFDKNLIQNINSSETGKKIYFNPKHPALGMNRTLKLLGLSPQPLIAVINFFDKGNTKRE